MRAPGRMNWREAMQYAGSLVLANKDDWRLPSLRELETLLDRSALFEKLRPEIRKDVPFADTLSYWSSTTFGDNTHNAWILMFDGAYALSYYKTNQYYVRCVRG